MGLVSLHNSLKRETLTFCHIPTHAEAEPFKSDSLFAGSLILHFQASKTVSMEILQLLNCPLLGTLL